MPTNKCNVSRSTGSHSGGLLADGLAGKGLCCRYANQITGPVINDVIISVIKESITGRFLDQMQPILAIHRF